MGLTRCPGETRHDDVTRASAAELRERLVSNPLSPDQWQQLESIVDALLDTPPERRALMTSWLRGLRLRARYYLFRARFDGEMETRCDSISSFGRRNTLRLA